MALTNWDYTSLAAAYLKRADYAPEAVDEILRVAGVADGASVCDVGAGAAHLTRPLLERRLRVTAIEPNDAMRAQGKSRTADFQDIVWRDGTAEETGEAAKTFDLVTYGSSFNVTNRPLALKEAVRILKPAGWIACLWNHRDINDPLQSRIERLIREYIPAYDYGSRREDQTPVIEASGLFGPVQRFERTILHRQTADDCIEAWRSHATLQRQAGDRFGVIVDGIASLVRSEGAAEIVVPYVTRVWMAQARK